MADNTIDSLQLEISANANIAENSLNRLADSLMKLQASVGAIQTGKFLSLSNGISGLAHAMTNMSASVKTQDFTRIASGLAKIAGVDVAGVRSAAVAMQGLTKGLNNLSFISFDSEGIANIANSIAKLGRGTVTQATKNIPNLTLALQGLKDGLEGFKIEGANFEALTQLTLSITKLGGKTATAAANGNITKLAAALKEMMTTLSTAPKVSQNLIQMTQALAQFAVAGGRAGTATTNLVRGFNILPTSTAKAKKGFSGLVGAIGKFYATYWLLIRGLGQFKKAIDISSDLTEVQNVVDVTFGNMADTMNKFASSALQNYGMSELMAKDIASRFQAMGVAMGFAQEPMSEMSIRLTELTGDLASFYNLTQENVAKKLQSIFNGETEPLMLAA